MIVNIIAYIPAHISGRIFHLINLYRSCLNINTSSFPILHKVSGTIIIVLDANHLQQLLLYLKKAA